MRELLTTGRMHNRVRMIVASFLIKDLLISWQKGEQWFWEHLVDADQASNAFNWQWVAGCGFDAAPYFRIFNPELQSRKFDPDGIYIKQYVHELKKLDADYIHTPHLAPSIVLKNADVEIGKTYPFPCVDHKEASTKALNYFKNL